MQTMNKIYLKKTHKKNAGKRILMLVLLALLMLNDDLNAQNEFNVMNGWRSYGNTSNALYDHLSDVAIEQLKSRKEKVDQLNSLSDWKEYQEWLRKTLNDAVGPFPPKTPLNAKIVETIKKQGFTVEHIIFESQPGFYVTSSMFIPVDRKKGAKLPVIIYCSGHSNSAYRGGSSQAKILNLVNKGFVVFAFDPIGQGERLQYYNPSTKKSSIGNSPTREHAYAGTQAFIAGSSLARYMIWDGIRAVDYLLTRKEVDPTRIGITGGSGGGTQSAYIAAFDERIYAAAPERYITNFTRLLQTQGPQDAEQNFLNGIALGLDHADLLIVRAPKPMLMITTSNDFFSIQGAMETVQEVAGIYEAYGKLGNFSMVEDISGHSSTKKNKEAMYAFFQKHLSIPGSAEDEETERLSKEELMVTKTGQVSTSLGGETIYSLNRKEVNKLTSRLNDQRSSQNHLARAVEKARNISGYQQPEGVQEVLVGKIRKEGYTIEKYFIEGEGDYVTPFLLFVPDKTNNKALIYLRPSGKLAAAKDSAQIKHLIGKGFTVLAPDLIGTGEMGRDNWGDLKVSKPYYNLWNASVLVNRSIVGVRAADVVRLTEFLQKARQTEEIYAIAYGNMSPVLLHAAAFDSRIKKVALVDPYLSYLPLVMNEYYNPDLIHNTAPAVLTGYDLPDLAASLAPKELLIIYTDGDTDKVADTEIFDKSMNYIKSIYESKGASKDLTTIHNKSWAETDLYYEFID
jgi:cephalosporin-C deacetylase-like acetyl esterase